MRDYELMMVLSPEVDEEGTQKAIERVKSFVSQQGGAMTHEEPWGRRKLAYPIGEFTEGNYVLTRFQMEAGHTAELDNTLKMTEEIIRYLVVRVEEPKPK